MNINLRDAVIKEEQKGFDHKHAESLVAQEVILRSIAHSRLKDSITLKGGVVMFNKTSSLRRATIDMDIDVIRYSIEPKSIDAFINALNFDSQGLRILRLGEIEKLKQEDYQGCRIRLSIEDKARYKLTLKMDVGVHTLFGINQENDSYFIGVTEENIVLLTNPSEQIFGEKVLSLVRHGIASTRYKDIADMYFLISNDLLTKEKVKRFFSFVLPVNHAKNIEDIYLRLSETFHDETFSPLASSASSNWTGMDYQVMTETILDFLGSFERLQKVKPKSWPQIL